MFKNQGTSQPEASQQQLATVNGDKSWAEQEELQELDEVQLATVVGGLVDLKLQFGGGLIGGYQLTFNV
ncbi:hypothetical protein Q5692_38860 [Microcoleus sp. C2C3]|uniref:hypothetical protein n=1 Tax=unclassified Microcoleus TaxID=2642155 RepID=UPI002FD07EF5